jgi:TatD DNase family protein
LNKNIPYINIHSHLPQADDEISILNVRADEHQISSGQYVSIGIHPWHINEYNITEALSFIDSAASKQNVLAIGECGLDKLINEPLKLQEQIFIDQIKIAEKFNKPLIIHCVKAFDDLIRIKKENKISVPMIIHGYNNNEQIARQLLQNDFYLSFGKALLEDGSNAQKIFPQIETDKIFLETDDSDVSIKSIFEKAASLKNISINKLKEKTISNFNNVFKHG